MILPYAKYQTVQAAGPLLPRDFFLHDLTFDRRGRAFFSHTSHGDLVSKEYEDDWRNLSTAILRLVGMLNLAPFVAEGRRRSLLEPLRGQPRRLSTLYAHLFAKYAVGGSEAVREAIREMELRMTAYEQAISEALDQGPHGDVTLLRELAINGADLDPFTPLLKKLEDIPDRGSRPSESRTRLLGQFTFEAHKPGQSWLKTANLVIRKLEPLRDTYPWAEGDIRLLKHLLNYRDAQGIREILYYAYDQARKHRWKST
jgi:hypothetical protein